MRDQTFFAVSRITDSFLSKVPSRAGAIIVIGGVAISHLLVAALIQILGPHTGYRVGGGLPHPWLGMYSAWDTGYYVAIAISWYPSALAPLWAFFPGYPALIAVTRLSGLDAWTSALVVSMTFCLVSVGLYYNIAEKYLRAPPVMCTLLYFLFPPVFVFSGVSYSESLFLGMSLLTWVLHTKRRDFSAGIAAAFLAIIKSYGLLITIPLAYDYLRSRHYKELVYLFMPVLAFLGWLLYGYAKTGVLLTPIKALSFWLSSKTAFLQQHPVEALTGSMVYWRLLYSFRVEIVAALSVLIVALISLRAVLRVNIALSLYLASSFIVLMFAAYSLSPSLARYVSFFFPMGFGLQTSNRIVFALAVILFLFIDFFAWKAFIFDGFN